MGLVSLIGASARPTPPGLEHSVEHAAAEAIDAMLAMRLAVARCSESPEERALMRAVADEAGELERFVRETLRGSPTDATDGRLDVARERLGA